MFTVNVHLKNSSLHGAGVFADQFIPEGSVIWRWSDDFDRSIPLKRIWDLSAHEQQWIFNHGYIPVYDPDHFHVPGGHSPFTNHSFSPNTALDYTRKGAIDFALKDIHPGEEITENYFSYFCRNRWQDWLDQLWDHTSGKGPQPWNV